MTSDKVEVQQKTRSTEQKHKTEGQQKLEEKDDSVFIWDWWDIFRKHLNAFKTTTRISCKDNMTCVVYCKMRSCN